MSDAHQVARTVPLTIAADHPCLDGHFPGRPLVPGVVLLEAVAQMLREQAGLRLVRVLEAKFLAPLVPDRQAMLTVSGSAPRFGFEIRDGDVLLARGRVEAQP